MKIEYVHYISVSAVLKVGYLGALASAIMKCFWQLVKAFIASPALTSWTHFSLHTDQAERDTPNSHLNPRNITVTMLFSDYRSVFKTIQRPSAQHRPVWQTASMANPSGAQMQHQTRLTDAVHCFCCGGYWQGCSNTNAQPPVVGLI